MLFKKKKKNAGLKRLSSILHVRIKFFFINSELASSKLRADTITFNVTEVLLFGLNLPHSESPINNQNYGKALTKFWWMEIIKKGIFSPIIIRMNHRFWTQKNFFFFFFILSFFEVFRSTLGIYFAHPARRLLTPKINPANIFRANLF